MARPLPQTLFLDACVLYPAPIRDLFMGLALEGLVRLKWNRRVEGEWIHNLLQDRPDLTPEQQARIRATPEKMKVVLAFQEPVVEGYESLVEKIQLPDANDRHVVAAAWWGKAEAILTFNLKDFPEEELGRWELLALHPDDYLTELAERLIRKNFLPDPLLRVLKRQRCALRKPPLGVEDFLEILRRAGLATFTEALGPYKGHL